MIQSQTMIVNQLVPLYSQSSFQDRSFRPNKINYRIFFRLYLPGFLCTMFLATTHKESIIKGRAV